MWFTGRVYYPVDAKVLVVGVMCCSEVTAITPVGTATLICRCQALIYPVPDESALHMRSCVEQFEVLREIAEAVTHGVGKLTHDIRAGYIGAGCVLTYRAETGIHGCHNIGVLILSSLLEHDRT